MAQVLCFGNLQFDILCRPVTSLPTPGTLQKIDAIDFALSGNGGNVAAALGRLGISTALAGYSGADLIGEQLRLTLTDLTVDISYLLRHPTAGTGTSVITLSPDGERSVLFVNGANAFFDLDTVPDSWFTNQKFVAVTAIFVLPQFTGEAVGRLFTRAHAAGCTTILNICYDGEQKGLPFLLPALKATDYFILNFTEGCQLTEEVLPQAIISNLERYTSGRVILTRGADGCCLRGPHGVQGISAVPVTAIDSTGAGDSFVAGFIAGLVQGRSILDCAHLGCKTAAFAVTGPGAYPRIPPLTEIDAATIYP